MPNKFILIIIFVIFFGSRVLPQDSALPIHTIQLTSSITPIPDSLQKRTVLIQLKDTSYTIEVSEKFLEGVRNGNEINKPDEPNWLLIIGLVVFVGAMIYYFIIKPRSKISNNTMVGDHTDGSSDATFFHDHNDHGHDFGDADDGGADSD